MSFSPTSGDTQPGTEPNLPDPVEVTDTDTHSNHLGYPHSKRGRPISWVAVVIMIVSFAVGGVAISLWIWPLFWACAGVFLAAGILGLAGGIMRDVH